MDTNKTDTLVRKLMALVDEWRKEGYAPQEILKAMTLVKDIKFSLTFTEK